MIVVIALVGMAAIFTATGTGMLIGTAGQDDDSAHAFRRGAMRLFRAAGLALLVLVLLVITGPVP